MRRQSCQINRLRRDNHGHASATIGVGDIDAINIGLLNTWIDTQGLAHFIGRAILGLPTIGVANPVNEVKIAKLVLLQEVAGTEPQVAFFKDVAQELLFRRRFVIRIAIKASAYIGRVDLANGLTNFIKSALLAEALFVSDWLFFFNIKTYQFYIETLLQITWNAANSTQLTFHIDETDIAFGRAVKLTDERDFEALFSTRPDVGSQAVPETGLKLVRLFLWMWRYADQIAEQFTNIRKDRAFLIDNIVPELGRGKLTAQHQSCPGIQDQAYTTDTACAVIER